MVAIAGAAVARGDQRAALQQLMEDLAQLSYAVAGVSFMDYLLPTSLDMPPITSIIVEGFPHKDGPFGAKGVGEASTIGIAAAIGNAIFDATGRRIKDLPITWDRILEALEGEREGSHGTF